MKLIDTPNPNAKKIESELTSHLKDDSLEQEKLLSQLKSVKGVSSVFFGPGFITITKYENIDWEKINQDITDIFDKL
tara:strand:+ start:27 stop:257 length:231 start_codon:yes stop_codon:yes gene_type:complete